MKIYSIKYVLALFFICSLALVQTLKLDTASAAYDGGRIIDNIVFLDSKSMAMNDVQSFLSSKGGQIADRSFVLDCDMAGSQAKNAYLSLGAPCGQTIPASNIIYYAAQVYGISPRVILATLQKEQSLVTSVNPTDRQYSQAMGYACPTSGDCSSSSNFFWQIDNGTWVLRFHYERAKGNNSWWYNSTSWTCGTEKNFYKPNLFPNQNVNFYDENGVMYRTHFISNAATSSMYCYTPHAYNNPQGLYGRAPYGSTGMYYSGSYNFVNFFEAWFGSTQSSLHVAKDEFKFERLIGASPALKNSNGTYGTYSTTITAGNALHVFYYNDTARTLDHSWFDNGAWSHETLDGLTQTPNGGVGADVGQYVSGYFDQKKNSIELFYYNRSSTSLRHGTLSISQSSWTFEEVDGSSNTNGRSDRNLGQYVTAAKYGDYIQAFYYDADLGNLRHAWTDARGWHFENLDGDAGSIARRAADVGETPTMAIFNNQIQLFYYDKSNRILRHAWTDARGWHFENLDGDKNSVLGYSSNVGWRATVKEFQGELFVAYYNPSNSVWRLAYADTSGWHAVDLDGSLRSLSRLNDPVRGQLSMEAYGNTLQIFYQDSKNGLTHSWASR